MPVLRVALAQVDITVGDLAGNAAVILDRTAEACAAGADLVLFPELAITGYPPEDLVFRSSFRAASRATTEKLAADLAAGGFGDVGVVIGYVGDDAGPRNALAFCFGGQVVSGYFNITCRTTACSMKPATSSRTRFEIVRFRGVDVPSPSARTCGRKAARSWWPGQRASAWS
jgi:NAD+ synthase (glutamine-hydrolysing)